MDFILYKIKRILTFITSWLYKHIIAINAGSGFYVRKNPLILGAKNIKIGNKCKIGDYLWLHAITSYAGVGFKPRITIGNNFHANNFLHISSIERIEIGNNVLIGSNVLISDHSHGDYSSSIACCHPEEAPFDRKLTKGCIVIGDNVWIGDGAKIIGNVCIGSGSVIGANSVITKDIPECMVVVGNNKCIKKWNKNGNVWDCLQ